MLDLRRGLALVAVLGCIAFVREVSLPGNALEDTSKALNTGPPLHADAAVDSALLLSVSPQPELVGAGLRCGQLGWLDQFPATAAGCMALVLALPAAGCSHTHFVYADLGDRNCACAPPAPAKCDGLGSQDVITAIYSSLFRVTALWGGAAPPAWVIRSRPEPPSELSEPSERDPWALKLPPNPPPACAVDTRKHRLPLYWLHVHQNAGSWITHIGAGIRTSVGFRAPVLSPQETFGGILWKLGNGWKSKGTADDSIDPWTCTERRRLMDRSNATWMMYERAIDPDKEICPGVFDYGTIMRENTGFLKSSLAHVVGGTMAVDDLFVYLNGTRPVPYDYLRKQAPWWGLCWGPRRRTPGPLAGDEIAGQFPQFDNFYIRNLLGHAVFWSPPGSINATHLQRAKAVLDNFQIIIMLESIKSQKIQLSSVAYWPDEVLNAKSVQSPHFHRNNHTFNDDHMAFLLELNRWDRELIEYAKVLANGLTAQARARLAFRAQCEAGEWKPPLQAT